MSLEDVHVRLICNELGLDKKAVRSALLLLTDGATVPFIARYRKEQTGSLDEVAILNIDQAYKKLTDLIKRKQTILESIEEQGSLTPSLKTKIEGCWNRVVLEDIYLPFKRKIKTKATIARGRGLEPLAKIIMAQNTSDLKSSCKKFITNDVPKVDDACEGARHIIAEWINENAQNRSRIRQLYQKTSILESTVVKKKKKEAIKYTDYFDFDEPLKKAPSHRVLAIFRGEKESLLRCKITVDQDSAFRIIADQVIKDLYSECGQQISMSIEDSLKRLMLPSIETEFKNKAKEKADLEAIRVFQNNLKNLLLEAPLGNKITMAIDPGFRTGCKVVVLNERGELLINDTIYPHPPQKQIEVSTKTIVKLLKKYKVHAIAIGNGTAGRETYQVLKEAFDKTNLADKVQLHLVNESGASIYSASPIAREEFPNHDITVRGAVSIGRRLMDPLSELVKIDAKSIGVGQYQHDVNQKLLKESLDNTVLLCVNSVGINLNSANEYILQHISGLGPKLAKNIIEYRKSNGSFKKREELAKVPRMGKKAYEQSAGFLRIKNGVNPLDDTGVHPESYKIIKKISKDIKQDITHIIQNEPLIQKLDLSRYIGEKIGMPTLLDIVKELKKPGLDPRGEARMVKFSDSVNSIEDLKEGQILHGIVSNVTKFGAFIDLGIKDSGLVHISQITNRFISDPSEELAVNQEVRVKVMELDVKRKRISLTMKDLT